MARLLLLRHGQSTWNASQRWQGQADPPLSDLGRRQAAEVAARLEPTDTVATSTLQRARVGAEIIAEAWGRDRPILIPELVERDVREFSGLTREQINEKYPGYLETDRRPPGWEDDDVLLARILDGLGWLADSIGDRSAVVVTHGGVIHRLQAHLDCSTERVPNMSGRWVTAGPDSLMAGKQVHPLDGVEIQAPTPDRRQEIQAPPPRRRGDSDPDTRPGVNPGGTAS